MYAPVQGDGVSEAGTWWNSSYLLRFPFSRFFVLPHPIVIRGDLIAHKAAGRF